ncbi:MAG: aspartate aminotransferase family protein [Alphaproteobacteria bacterium]
MTASESVIPNNLDAFFMGFTANRQFKEKPRMVKAAKDMHYFAADNGRAILDGSAGLWCVHAGHCRQPIVDAISAAAGELDYGPTFNFGHPKVFELATRVTDLAGENFTHMFFGNSGSEAVESALKIAIGYHQARGEGSRTRLIGRERAYHGVNFGGMSVGGLVKNREGFGPGLPGVAHLRHTHLPGQNKFTRGEVEHGVELAEDLERLVGLHGAQTIAAVIVEPFAGSTGVLPPPIGYLKRLREICDKHGILLIFDEVITGFGRLGTPFAEQYFGVTPDMITCAKGLTNAAVPMGGVIMGPHIYNAFMSGPSHVNELFHGYTYAGHPLAAAAGLATLDVYRDEGLFERVDALTDLWADTMHALKDAPYVTDIRTIGLVAAIDLEGEAGAPGKRGFEAGCKAFEEQDTMVRIAADSIILSPPFIISENQIDELATNVRATLEAL